MSVGKEKINVLSLFDGISCGQIALEKLGIEVENYFASEIDKHAIKVTQANYPNTKQLGSVIDVKAKDLPKIDLLIGGSPCQGFSIAGKKLNFEDERSKLFFEFVRLKNELNPKYFLLENVRMTDDIADTIDELLGVKRIFIDSRNFTGMIRKRYYWTNIPIGEIPTKNVVIEDLLDNETFDRDLNFFLDRTKYEPTTSYDGIITINPRDNNGKQTWQRGRVYDIKGSCPTICASLFDLNITKDHKTWRKLTINECEKLQGVPKDYTSIVSKNERGKQLGSGWNVDTVAFIFSFLRGKNFLNSFSHDGRDKSDGIGGNKPIDQLANDVDASESGLHLQNVSDAVCHYWHCLDQYKGKCINGSYWKTCKNRQTER